MDSWRHAVNTFCFATLVIAFSGFRCTRFPGTSTQFAFRGANYTSWSSEEYTTPLSDASLFLLKSTGANYIALLVTGYMDRANSTEIYADPLRTPSDPSLVHAMQVARSYGLKIMLKPHVDSKDGVWRGSISPSDIEAWFASYKRFLVHYAVLAAAHEVELFCVGTEFRSLSGPEFRAHWEEIIGAVRQVYPGPLVYAANWDEYSS
ncbi:MAG: hypothetical protein ABDI20_09460, partial [Candidatus Bipolaricaulaceae bacterium]